MENVGLKIHSAAVRNLLRLSRFVKYEKSEDRRFRHHSFAGSVRGRQPPQRAVETIVVLVFYFPSVSGVDGLYGVALRTLYGAGAWS